MRSQLKRARVSAGYTQEELAGFLGLSQQTISKYEKAVTTPSHFKIIRDCERLLGVRAEQLFPDVFDEKTFV